MIGKKYLYKIYDVDGRYIKTWDDAGTPEFDLKINSGYSELNVKLPRRFNDFGEGSDIAIGNKLIVAVSDVESPDGVKIYSGKLSKYHLVMTGKEQYIEATFTGYVTELAKRIVESGGNTTINYSTEDPADVIKDVLDNVAGVVTYDSTSIDDTGVSVSYDLIQNTALEAIERMTDISPQNWYWYVDSNDLLQFHEFDPSNPLKLFIGNHINRLEVVKSGETLFNTYYFLGGDSPQLYIKRERTSSQTEYGQSDKREQDERITVSATAEQRATSFLDQYAKLQMEVTCTVIDSNVDPKKGVDIDILRPGQAIQIIDPDVNVRTTKWDSATWDIDSWDYDIKVALNQVLRLEEIQYRGTHAVLKLGTVLPKIGEEIYKNTIQLETFRGKDSPTAPS